MTHDHSQYLKSELAILDRFLGEIPEEDVIDRASIEAQKFHILEALESLQSSQPEPARTTLLFKGGPVRGRRGVLSTFATEATAAFAKAVSAVAASSDGPLPTRGRVTHKPQRELFIVGTVAGSFGFELEEIAPEGVAVDESNQDAIEQTQLIILSAIGSSDDLLADNAAAVDPRARESIRVFLDVVAKADAYVEIQTEDKTVAFKSTEEVKAAREKLSASNISESEKEVIGHFTGLLPTGRSFEFKLEFGEVVFGKASKSVEKIESINLHLHEPTFVQFKIVRVKNGKPRYTLIGLPEFIEDESFGEDLSAPRTAKPGEVCPQSGSWRMYANSSQTPVPIERGEAMPALPAPAARKEQEVWVLQQEVDQ
ncbi:MAG: hypothetical protein V4719_14635 [Planctomycetota bacterium]